MDTAHLHILELRLFNERQRLCLATAPAEIELRSVWVRQMERELMDEKTRLGMELCHLNDDELLEALYN